MRLRFKPSHISKGIYKKCFMGDFLFADFRQKLSECKSNLPWKVFEKVRPSESTLRAGSRPSFIKLTHTTAMVVILTKGL